MARAVGKSAPTPREPPPGAKEIITKGKGARCFFFGCRKGVRRKIAAGIGSFAPPGLGEKFTRFLDPPLAQWATAFRPYRGL